MEEVKNAILVLLIIGAVFCEDVVIQEENPEDNNREIREFDQEGWRAVEAFPPSDLGWIPRDDIKDSDQIKLKRRRLRKRKRRPPIQNAEGEEVYPRRRVRPFRLEQISQPWEEMSEENIKPNNRRRLPLPYPSSEEIEKETNETEEIVIGTQMKDIEEKPLEASILVEEKPEPQIMQNSLADLKNLLKQSGGKLSLSEILQQKNLSLAELLKGNERAISALTEAPQKSQLITESTTEQYNKYKRLPPSIGLKPSKNSVQEDPTEESLTEKETLDAQRKRLALLQPKENKIFTNVIKFDVINEPTTERRIFIPANSKFAGVEYSNINSNEDEVDTTTERKTTITSAATTVTLTSTSTTEKFKETTTTTTHPTTKLFRFRGKLPTTNAKLRITTKKINLIEKERYPLSFEFSKPFKIDINELLGFENEKKEEIITVAEDKTDGPMKVSIDLETMFNKSFKRPMEAFVPIPEPVVELTTNISEDSNGTYVTAKQEIMEVMKDPASREKLSRILEYRNMTLEELVEQRERGSSQLHLADIFHNKTREPEPKDEPFVGQISPEFFQNIAKSSRQQKSTNFDDVTKVSSTDAPTSTMKDVTSKQKESFPTVTVKLSKNSEGADTFPWKQLYPDLFPETNDIEKLDSTGEFNEILESIDIESRLTANSDEGLFSSIPSGVKSAIFVSLAIIGLSIVVFLAVLLLFKWIQRKNKSLNYCSSLTTKFRTPIMLQGRPTTAIKTFMNETLGRKKNYYKSTLQSMSDEIWDSNRDRKESF